MNRTRILFLLPISAFLLLGLYLMAGLGRNPSFVPSTLIDRPAPEFSLPPIEGRDAGLATGDLRGDVSLVNVFASWCAPCLQEHPVLMRIAADGSVPIYGINWKEKPGDGARWLARYGDPYAKVGDDATGRVAIEFGVTGAPETFVVDRAGAVRHKHTGPITREVWRDELAPLIEELKNASPAGDRSAS